MPAGFVILLWFCYVKIENIRLDLNENHILNRTRSFAGTLLKNYNPSSFDYSLYYIYANQGQLLR
jgi:hypothetical protein